MLEHTLMQHPARFTGAMVTKFRSLSPAVFAALSATLLTLVVLALLLVLGGCAPGAREAGSDAGTFGVVEAPPELPGGDGTVFADTSPAADLGDGSIHDPNGISVHAEHAAMAGLEPALHDAVLAAADRAAAEGIELRVTSGWRSAELQQQLLDDAVLNYGSEAEARKWVDTPQRSSHVTGQAVDIGGLEESLWMGQYGAEFGLCQTFDNERWHFELSEIEADGTCPAPPYMSAAERP